LLWKYGSKPASTIAKLIGAERTHVYKMLQQMISRSIIAQSTHQGVTNFYIPSETIFDQYYSAQQSLIDQSKAELPKVYEELSQLESQSVGKKPLYRIREGHEGMKQMFEVMLQQLKDDRLSVIKIISMSTLETTATTPRNLQSYASHFFNYCKNNAISVQTTLATGVMIPEQIISLTSIDELANLPA
jgi:sugar-specific transcriptional regulator TrmB